MKQLCDRFPEAKRLLRERGGHRIILFGSLATDSVRESSDIDLSVEGLTEEQHHRALTELMELFGCSVDLVRLEDVNESLRRRIEDEGKPL